jgi:hypothetical protein
MMPGAEVFADVAGYQTYRTSTGLRPDIVARYAGRYYYWEVKPNTPYGNLTGRAQLTAYDACFVGRGSRGMPLGGWTGAMSTTGGLGVHDSGIPGLIFYEKDQRDIIREAVRVANFVVPQLQPEFLLE